MPAVPPLSGGLRPEYITSVRASSRAHTIYSLEDAKTALAINLDDNLEDGRIIDLLQEAQAIVEKAAGISLASSAVIVEYTNPGEFWTSDGYGYYGGYARARRNKHQYCNPAVLQLTESDFASVERVEQINSDGAATALDAADYEVIYADDRAYVRRLDGSYFRDGPGIVARVNATRGIRTGSHRHYLARNAMNMLVVEANKQRGTMSPQIYTQNRSFTNAIDLLKSNTDYPDII